MNNAASPKRSPIDELMPPWCRHKCKDASLGNTKRPQNARSIIHSWFQLYLTHDDFVSTFSVSYNEFRALPGWKQKELKKSAGLF